jgi:hypothetical protein
MSALVGLGRRTVTGMLSASAQQFDDWSAAYRIFQRERFDRDALFAPARLAVVNCLGKKDPLVAVMDDTLIRKHGKKVYGTGWKRDPLGPKFHPNFVWGQRFLQLSAVLPEKPGISRARGIPIDFTHAPSPRKPSKKSSPQEWEEYRRLQKTMKASAVGLARVRQLRSQLDADPQEKDRPRLVAVDGGFTNRTVFRDLPHDTAAIGRIRKDARIFLPPDGSDAPRRGRPRWFGEALPTPEQIRQDSSVEWITVAAYGSGQVHHFQVKTLSPIRWLGSGHRDVRLVIISPLAYRPRKGARLLYRNPAYLICTDPELSLEQILQAYLWRWEIELNFRDEKTLLGVGEAQVRTEIAVESVPTLIVAAYAFLLLAGTEAKGSQPALPPPKWRKSLAGERDSTPRLIGLLRSQLWGKAMNVNLNHFVKNTEGKTKPTLLADALPSAVCYAFR